MSKQKIDQILTHYLDNEKVEVTYKMLSRKCQISVNQAKQALEGYYSKSSNGGVIPVYFICKNNSEYFIGFEPKSTDSKILHIYALSPSNLSIANQKLNDGMLEDSLYLIDSSVASSDTSDTVQKCRSILHPTVTYSKEKKPTVKSEIVPAPMLKSNSAPTMVKQSSKVTAAQSKMGKSNSTSFFAAKVKQESKPKAPAKPKPTKTAAPVIITGEDTAGTLSKPKVVLMPADDDDAPVVFLPPKSSFPVAVSKESAAQANQIVNMFEADELEPTNGEAPIDDVVMEPVKEEEVDMQVSTEQNSTKVIKRRKVKKTESYMDGKYLKTRDVEVWEEYESDEYTTKRKNTGSIFERPAAAAAKPKTATKKQTAIKNQRSIASFFKKA